MPVSFGNIDYDLYDSNVNYLGIGYVYDSNVRVDNVFNYRLNIGFEYFQHNLSYDEFIVYDPQAETAIYSHQSSMNKRARLLSDHTFGFAVIRRPIFKYWIGPSLRLGLIGIDDLGITTGFGFTLAGFNINLGSKFTISIEAGYMYNQDIFFHNIKTITYFDGINYHDKQYASAKSNLILLKFSLLSLKP